VRWRSCQHERDTVLRIGRLAPVPRPGRYGSGTAGQHEARRFFYGGSGALARRPSAPPLRLARNGGVCLAGCPLRCPASPAPLKGRDEGTAYESQRPLPGSACQSPGGQDLGGTTTVTGRSDANRKAGVRILSGAPTPPNPRFLAIRRTSPRRQKHRSGRARVWSTVIGPVQPFRASTCLASLSRV
jgi:hypothetical protein